VSLPRCGVCAASLSDCAANVTARTSATLKVSVLLRVAKLKAAIDSRMNVAASTREAAVVDGIGQSSTAASPRDGG
jgi:hypothetical protein